jgi:hypothetical protein
MKNPLPAPVVRVASALALAAVLFQSGREVGRLEGLAEGPKVSKDAGNEMVSAAFKPETPAPVPAEAKPAVTVGDPVGESVDVITPLNVRDPSALVMGPGASSYGNCAPPPPNPPRLLPPDVEPAAPAKARKVKPLPEGRLLELLKKKDSSKELDVPKSY